MNKISKIIVPVDFGQHTEKLVDFSMFMAEKLSSEILFFHVSESFEGYTGFNHPSMDEIDKELRIHSEQEMKRLLKKVQSDCQNCSGKVVNGDIVDEIVACAERSGAQMIIIGTHGAKGIEKILVGNIAERVVRNAPCPTLLFNPYRNT
jgi:nucleotide-binding universal stress UspA family protein